MKNLWNIKEIETENLILKKPQDTADAQKCHENFWNSYETAKFMLWEPTKNVEDAKTKMAKWIEYQKDHLQWFIYDKKSDEPIGFFSVEKLNDNVYGSLGLCFGEKNVGKGYGSEIMTTMIGYLKNLGAKKIEYSFLSGNIPSQKLAEKFGFKYSHKETRIRKHDGKEFDEIFYILEL